MFVLVSFDFVFACIFVVTANVSQNVYVYIRTNVLTEGKIDDVVDDTLLDRTKPVCFFICRPLRVYRRSSRDGVRLVRMLLQQREKNIFSFTNLGVTGISLGILEEV